MIPASIYFPKFCYLAVATIVERFIAQMSAKEI